MSHNVPFLSTFHGTFVVMLLRIERIVTVKTRQQLLHYAGCPQLTQTAAPAGVQDERTSSPHPASPAHQPPPKESPAESQRVADDRQQRDPKCRWQRDGSRASVEFQSSAKDCVRTETRCRHLKGEVQRVSARIQCSRKRRRVLLVSGGIQRISSLPSQLTRATVVSVSVILNLSPCKTGRQSNRAFQACR
jgi:hypothetical protein